MMSSDKKTDIKINVIYEDNHLLVVEKPVNILSQGDNTGDPDMLTLLKQYIKEKYDKPGEVYLGLVHRLDRPVGGVMVFARTSKAAARLSEQIRKREFRKTYNAVVHGIPSRKSGTLRDFLLKDPASNTVSIVPEGTEGAKEAVLDYELLDSSEGFSLLQINLHTGRPHQIRVQLAALGTPLYGDQKYGRQLNKAGQQLALWAVEICCTHPTQKNEMCFKCPPPRIHPWDLFPIDI